MLWSESLKHSGGSLCTCSRWMFTRLHQWITSSLPIIGHITILPFSPKLMVLIQSFFITLMANLYSFFDFQAFTCQTGSSVRSWIWCTIGDKLLLLLISRRPWKFHTQLLDASHSQTHTNQIRSWKDYILYIGQDYWNPCYDPSLLFARGCHFFK